MNQDKLLQAESSPTEEPSSDPRLGEFPERWTWLD
jgi:hypothetical protein